MNRAATLAELRAVLNVATPDVTWADTTLYRYLAEGQDRFCEDTGFFRDIATYSLTLVTNTALYAIDDRIIEVLDIYDGSRRLGKVAIDDYLLNTSTGEPSSWRADQTTGYIHLWPTPTSDYNGDIYQMHVWRYSTTDFAASGDLELRERYQRACIEWAAYKAFNHHDIEAQDPVKAADHLKAYKDYVSDGVAAMRRLHGIGSRVGTNPAYRT